MEFIDRIIAVASEKTGLMFIRVYVRSSITREQLNVIVAQLGRFLVEVVREKDCTLLFSTVPWWTEGESCL